MLVDLSYLAGELTFIISRHFYWVEKQATVQIRPTVIYDVV